MRIEKPSFYDDEAVLLGSADKAVIVEFICWSIHFKQGNYNQNINDHYFFDGHWWMQDSFQAWHKRLPWIGEKTIRRIFKDLVSAGFIIKKSGKSIAGGNQPNFYRPNPEKLPRRLEYTKIPPLGQNVPTPLGQNVPPLGQNVLFHLFTPNQTTNQGTNNITMSPAPAAGRLCEDLPVFENDQSEGQEEHMAQEEQNGTALGLAMPAPTRVTPKKQKAVKMQIRTWEPTDPFAAVFGNLTKLDICRVKFDREDFRTWLTAVMEELSLTIPELIRTSNEWQEYHNEKTKKPVAVKNSFRTWINNYTRGRDKYGRQQQPNNPLWKNKPDFSANDSDKFKDFDENKPWL